MKRINGMIAVKRTMKQWSVLNREQHQDKALLKKTNQRYLKFMWLMIHFFELSAHWNGALCSPQPSLAPPITAFTTSQSIPIYEHNFQILTGKNLKRP